MSGNMGGIQHAAPLPKKTKHSQRNTEITAVIDYFRDSEKIMRNMDASAQLQSSKYQARWLKERKTLGVHLSRAG